MDTDTISFKKKQKQKTGTLNNIYVWGGGGVEDKNVNPSRNANGSYLFVSLQWDDAVKNYDMWIQKRNNVMKTIIQYMIIEETEKSGKK